MGKDNTSPIESAAEEAPIVETLEEQMERLTSETPVDEEVPSEQAESEKPDSEEPEPEEDESDPEKEEEEEEAEPKGLTPEAQQAVDRKIGKLTAKRKEAEEKAETFQAQAETEKQRADELQSKLEESFAEQALSLGFAPQFLEKQELDVLKKDDELAQQERFFFENLDGYEDPNSGKEYTAKQMRSFYMEVREHRAKVSGQVSAIRSQRSKEMLEVIEAGRAALSQRKGPNGKQASPVDKPKEAKRKEQAPKVTYPASSAPGKPPINTPRNGRFDGEELKKEGATRSALEKQFAGFIGD